MLDVSRGIGIGLEEKGCETEQKGQKQTEQKQK